MHVTRLLPAATGDGTPGAEAALLAVPLVLVLLALVASRRRRREADARQAAIREGDHVVTAAGMLGRVVQFQGDVARLEVAPGVVVEFDRRAVVSTVPEPSAAAPTAVAGADAVPNKEQ